MRDVGFDLHHELDAKRIRLVHGSPQKVNEYLFEDEPARTFERIAALADADVLVFGPVRSLRSSDEAEVH